MPVTTCRHHESWYLEINRAEGDDWPDLRPYTGARYQIQPDRITVLIERGITPRVTVSGLRIRKNGETGSLRTGYRIWRGDDAPWIDEVLAAARAEHNLTDEALERP